MGNVGGLEIVVVLLVALVVLGPDKLPEAVRKAGNVIGEFRRVSKSFQDEMRSAAMLDDIGIEAAARKSGENAVAASKAAQDQLEPKGRSLSEGTEPFVNTDGPRGDSEPTESPNAAVDKPPANASAAGDAPVDADLLDPDDTPPIESDS